MAKSNYCNRALGDMTVRQLAHLRLMNDRLAEAELQVRDRLLGADFHIHVYCIASKPSEGPSSYRETVVARLDSSASLASPGGKTVDQIALHGRARSAPDPLADMTMCRLFWEIWERELGGDWGKLLAIDEIHVELIGLQPIPQAKIMRSLIATTSERKRKSWEATLHVDLAAKCPDYRSTV